LKNSEQRTEKLPRFVSTLHKYQSGLHGLADACKRGYGCCPYVRSVINGVETTSLLVAKSRLVPIQPLSIPKLELCAAVLLNRTYQLKHKLKPYISKVYFWTDAKTVPQWLGMHSSQLPTFESDRISELQSYTHDVEWRYVSSSRNPADIVSLGCSVKDLQHKMWFTGPDFLKGSESEWPCLPNPLNPPLYDNPSSNIVIPSVIDDLINRLSSYFRTLRTLSFVYRVFNRIPAARNSTVREVVHVSANELNHNQQHRFTRLYAEFIHRSTLHAGARVLLSLLREEVWNALTASTTSLVSCHTSWEISLRIDCTASAHIWCQEMSSAGPS